MHHIMRVYYFLAWLAIIAGTALILLLLFWFIYPYKILVFRTNPLNVIEDVTSTGKDLSYEIDSCKYMNIPAEVTTQYVDDVIYTSPTVTVNNPVGCAKRTVVQTVPNLPSGTYQLRKVYVYHPNPIRTITYTVSSEKFQIQEAQ